MNNEKLTKQDVSEISKGVTSLFGRRIGYAYEVNAHPESLEMGEATPLRLMVGEIPAHYTEPDPASTSDTRDSLEIVVTNSREYIEDDHYNYFYARKENGKWIVS